MTRLRRDYIGARYTVEGCEFRIGRRAPAIDARLAQLGAREGVLVTAWNPRSRRMPRGWNEQQQRRLLRHLRRRALLPAESGVGRWREEQVLVLAPVAQVMRVARLFRQHAVVVIRRGRKARLAWTAEFA